MLGKKWCSKREQDLQRVYGSPPSTVLLPLPIHGSLGENVLSKSRSLSLSPALRKLPVELGFDRTHEKDSRTTTKDMGKLFSSMVPFDTCLQNRVQVEKHGYLKIRILFFVL